RGKTFDSEFTEALYADINALYRLDQMKSMNGAAPTDLGPLPKTSVVLLTSLGVAWILIACVFIRQYIKNKKTDN
nr:ABC transporter substrate-binding protein [Lachnospiraceae bacterium]